MTVDTDISRLEHISSNELTINKSFAPSKAFKDTMRQGCHAVTWFCILSAAQERRPGFPKQPSHLPQGTHLSSHDRQSDLVVKESKLGRSSRKASEIVVAGLVVASTFGQVLLSAWNA